jgi:hypothetical protein
MKIWQAIKGFIFWTYERGSIHYDVMVTLILVFIFLTPLKVDFRDKPREQPGHPSGVVVHPDGDTLVYQLGADSVAPPRDDAAVRRSAQQVIGKIARGPVEIVKWEPVCKPGTIVCRADGDRVVAFNVWVRY